MAKVATQREARRGAGRRARQFGDTRCAICLDAYGPGKAHVVLVPCGVRLPTLEPIASAG